MLMLLLIYLCSHALLIQINIFLVKPSVSTIGNIHSYHSLLLVWMIFYFYSFLFFCFFFPSCFWDCINILLNSLTLSFFFGFVPCVGYVWYIHSVCYILKHMIDNNITSSSSCSNNINSTKPHRKLN